MDINKINNTEGFFDLPDALAPDHVKETNEFGLKVARHIAQEWFQGGYLSKQNCLFQDRTKFIRDMRAYYRGEQDTKKYKDWFSKNEQDLCMVDNLDFTVINWAEKFCNIPINGIDDNFYRLDIRSIDRLSSLEKQTQFIKHKRNQIAKPMLEKAKALGMPDLVPQGFVGETDEEIQLFQEINERPKIEIAEEKLIDFTKKSNHWENLKYHLDRDIVNLGIQAVRCWIDPNDGVKLDYVDPEYFGHSFCNKNDFSDVYYYFYTEEITINDLRRESLFSDKVMREIAEKYAQQNNLYTNFDTCEINEILGMKVQIMRFCYKSSKEIVYKKYYDKKGNVRKLAKRDSEWAGKEEITEKSRCKKVLDTWYEGNYVIASQNVIYGWKECENLAKDQMNKVLPPFIVRTTNIYKNALKSFLSNIIPLLDQLNYSTIKIQHLYRELKPDLIEIDVDQLADLTDEGKGKKSEVWQQALSILNVKGVVVKKRVDMGEMGVKDGSAARNAPQQQGSALGPLLNVFANYYNQLREVTGVNPAVDGSIRQDSLVGVNQMMMLAYNTSTKHIVDTATMFDKKVCETISSRIKTIWMFDEAKSIRDMYAMALGELDMDVLEALKNRHLHEFGFTVEMVPDKEMLNDLKQDLNIALQEQTIDLSEKYQILELAKSNYKKAFEYMRFIRNRRLKQKAQEQQENMRLQSESNIASTQAAEEAKVKGYQTTKAVDLDYEKQMAQIRLMEHKAKLEIELPKEQREFEEEVYIEKIKNLNLSDLTEYKEKAKDERTKLQASQQSKMIDQRNNSKDPIDFKNEMSENSNPIEELLTQMQ